MTSFDNQRKDNDPHDLLDKSGDDQNRFSSDDEDFFARAEVPNQAHDIGLVAQNYSQASDEEAEQKYR